MSKLESNSALREHRGPRVVLQRGDKTTALKLWGRYYNPAVGRFNRLDPFSGNVREPLSLQKYNYAEGDPVNNWDPSGTISLGQTLAVVGISLNAASFVNNVTNSFSAASRGDVRGASESATWAMVDAAFLFLPFAGPGAGALRTTVGTTAIQLSRVGVQASAIWGYISALAPAVRGANFTFAKSSTGGAPGNFEYSEGPGEWRSGSEPGVGPGRAFQSSRTGKPADWIYWLKGVKFDGFRSAGNTLLEAKNNGWEWLLRQPWFTAKGGGLEGMVNQANRQLKAARGTGARVVWEVEGQGSARAIEAELRANRVTVGSNGITVVPIP